MSRWGPPKRTAADRERDCLMFATTARIEAVRATSAEQMAGRYGVDLKFAEYHRTLRLNREGVA